MMDSREIRLMQSPKTEFITGNGISIKPKDYLIEDVKDDETYIVHRELLSDERHYYSSQEVMKYNNKFYLLNICQCETLQKAIEEIHSFWGDISIN